MGMAMTAPLTGWIGDWLAGKWQECSGDYKPDGQMNVTESHDEQKRISWWDGW